MNPAVREEQALRGPKDVTDDIIHQQVKDDRLLFTYRIVSTILTSVHPEKVPVKRQTASEL